MERLPDVLLVGILDLLPLQDVARSREINHRFLKLSPLGRTSRVYFSETFSIHEDDEPSAMMVEFFEKTGHQFTSFSWYTWEPVRLSFIDMLARCCPHLTKLHLDTDLNMYNAIACLPADSSVYQGLIHLTISGLTIATFSRFVKLRQLRSVLEDSRLELSQGGVDLWTKATTLLAQLELLDGRDFGGLLPRVVDQLLAGFQAAPLGNGPPLKPRPIKAFKGPLEVSSCGLSKCCTSDIALLFPNLANLRFMDPCQCTELLRWVELFPKLTSLTLSMVKWLDSSTGDPGQSDTAKHAPFSEVFGQLVNLQCLEMYRIDTLDVSLLLEWLPTQCHSSLVSLDIQRCCLDGDNMSRVLSDTSSPQLTALVRLCVLWDAINVCKCGCSDQQIGRPGTHPPLTDANLVAILRHCPSLRSLDVGGCALVTDALWPALRAHSPRLTTLGLEHTGVTKQGLQRFALERRAANTESLDNVSISFPSFTTVTVSFPFTEQDAQAIEGSGLTVKPTFRQWDVNDSMEAVSWG